jgi:hypothetical protein
MNNVYNIYPDFSPELYKELYYDLKPYNDNELFEHYHKHGREENRICNIRQFYEVYPDFDINLYKELYYDLKSFNDHDIFGHYYKHGREENRICSINQFYERYPGFIFELYKELYVDLKEYNDIELFGHYNKHGHEENRISSINQFYERYPDFSTTIYKDFNYDLRENNDTELFGHYHKHGCHENRVYSKDTFFSNISTSIDTFYLIYPYFNDIFFKTFQRQYNDCSEIELIYNFYLSDKSTIVYSLKTFYNNYPDFDYDLYRYINPKIQNIGEADVIIDWYNNGCDYSFLETKTDNYKKKKNILIYIHMQKFSFSDGGTLVQYYLASILDKIGVKVRLHSEIIIKNPLFNNHYDDDFKIDDNLVVIYCEGIKGNPLNAPNIVRWMLSELGKNVPYQYLYTWGKKELVYYFNYELKFEKNLIKMNKIYKLLTCLYLNPEIKQTNYSARSGTCITFRKTWIHSSHINSIHPMESFEIKREHRQEDYIHFFNQYEYFISYDPLTFINIIAAICGCISIIYPIEGVSKYEWLKMTAAWPYLKVKHLDNLYGIAYGMNDIEYARNTIHLVKKQWDEIIEFSLNQSILPFLDDINHLENLENTVENNYLL